MLSPRRKNLRSSVKLSAKRGNFSALAIEIAISNLNRSTFAKMTVKIDEILRSRQKLTRSVFAIIHVFFSPFQLFGFNNRENAQAVVLVRFGCY